MLKRATSSMSRRAAYDGTHACQTEGSLCVWTRDRLPVGQSRHWRHGRLADAFVLLTVSCHGANVSFDRWQRAGGYDPSSRLVNQWPAEWWNTRGHGGQLCTTDSGDVRGQTNYGRGKCINTIVVI